MTKEMIPNKSIIGSIVKSTGFADSDRIIELTDGASDANATTIDITWEKSTKFPGKRKLVVEDNGDGFLNPSTGIPTILSDFGAIPTDRDGKHKAFGVGTRGFCVVVAMEGGDVFCDSHDGETTDKFNIVWENDTCKIKEYGNSDRTKQGTTFTLDGINSNLSPTELKKILSVKYYHSSKRAKGELNGIDINVNGKSVIFHDPFFRWKDDIPEVFYHEETTVKANGDTYRLYSTHMVHGGEKNQVFQELSDVSEHLTKTPYEYNDGLKPSNSGLYVKRNDRYLSHGDAFFGYGKKKNVRNKGHNLNGIRIEVENMTGDGLEFGTINKSKTQMQQMMQKPEFEPLFDKIAEIVTRYEADYKRISDTKGNSTRQNSDIIAGRVNNEIGGVYGSFGQPYVDVEFVDKGDRPTYSVNGTTTMDNHKSVHFKVPETYRHRDDNDDTLVNQLTEFTLFIHDNVNIIGDK